MRKKSKKGYKNLIINHSIKPKSKIYDYGLGILKTYLAFLIVASHQFSRKTTKNEIILMLYDNRNIHVPSFFIMSFYFTCHNLLSLNPKKILNRFIRLFIPYFGWPIIILQINRKYNQIFKAKFPESIEALKYQLLWGDGYVGQFWFQWDLIVTTFLFVIIIFTFRKNCLFILILVLILFYYCQYTGNYFQKYLYLKKSNNYPVERMFEMIPFGVTYHVVNNYQLFRKIKGFLYQGIDLNIRSICAIFIFSLFPSDRIKNKYLHKVFNLLTNYSAGPFYLHISIRDYCRNYIYEMKNGTLLGTFYNFLICYSISVVGDLIFGKTLLKYLFC